MRRDKQIQIWQRGNSSSSRSAAVESMWLPSFLACGATLTLVVHPASTTHTLIHPSHSAMSVPPKASGCDDLRATTVLSVAIAALHHSEQYERQTRVRSMAQWAVVLEELDAATIWPEEEDSDDGPQAKRTRRVKERKVWKESAWWKQLQEEELLDHMSEAAKVFRERFRVPYPFFLRLVELSREKQWFSTGGEDARGREGIPVELKVRSKFIKIRSSSSAVRVCRERWYLYCCIYIYYIDMYRICLLL